MSEKRLKVILPLGILFVGIVATVILIKSRAPAPTRPPQEFAPLVRVVETTLESRRLRVSTQGTVRPRTETALVSEVNGRVIRVAQSFAAGGFFEKGDVLLQIDPRDYELAVVTARGEVARARVRFETEEAQAKVARDEWEDLGRGEGSPLATRELQVDEARAALAAAEAALERAERNLARTRIRAPFVGRVRQKTADVGQYLSPGVTVATVFAVDYVEIRLPIPDAELAYLDMPVNYRRDDASDTGPEVQLFADFAGERREWPGRIVRVEGEIDATSRMVHAIAQVDDPYGIVEGRDPTPLTVGLFVEAEILGHHVENVFVLPRPALRQGDMVLVVDADNRLRFRQVDVLKADRNQVIITSGLEEGELVCVSTLEAVTDGMKVRTRKSLIDAAPEELQTQGGDAVGGER